MTANPAPNSYEELTDEPEDRLLERRRGADELAGKLLVEAIKMLFLINGGSLVALLALFGSMAQGTRPLPVGIDNVFTNFVVGLMAAALAAVIAWVIYDTTSTAYTAKLQSKNVEGWGNTIGVAIFLFAVCLITSLVFAALGFFEAGDVLRLYSELPKT